MENSVENAVVAPRPRSSSRGPFLLVAATVALYFFYFIAQGNHKALAGWETDLLTATEKAAASDRQILVAFSMQGCPPCRAMEQQVLDTDEVRRGLKGFVPVHIDIDRQREVANRFEVFGTPTYVVLSVTGEVLARTSGYLPVDAFLAFLNSAKPILQSSATPVGD